MVNKKTDNTFEQSFQRLEAIVSDLENGKLSLNESLNSFEEAIGLVKICEDTLENVKQKVNILTKNTDGTIVSSHFTESQDET